MKHLLNEKDYQEIILNLIMNGECLEDAAETCGHDEELSDWKKTKKTAMKLSGITRNDINQRIAKDVQDANAKAEDNYYHNKDKERAKFASEDDKILKELGLR